MGKDDLVFAFFPCTRFETRHYLNTRCGNSGTKVWNDIQRCEYSRKMFNETNHNYQLISKLFVIALTRGFRMVVENPYSKPHVLNEFFPIKPKVTHNDRSLYGDKFRKPTQYWFVNFDPSNNFLFENLQVPDSELVRVDDCRNQVEKSMISPVYANRFIREYII